MKSFSNIFLKKKILVYGLGKSGLSTLKFLQKKSEIYAYDDFNNRIKNLKLKKIIKLNKIKKIKFDKIILSPGIDIYNCKLSNFLRSNKDKIYTDLDVFFSFNKNYCITITGTNGKSTTCQLLYEVLRNQKFDVRLVGNIGKPILSERKIKEKTIFVIEASSYQLEYSKIFKSKYAVIINISPDHIERHKTLNNYIKAKLKLIESQSKGDLAFVKKKDKLIDKGLNSIKFNSKLVKIDTKINNSFLKKIKNNYFSNEANKENLLFVYEISKKLNLDKKLFLNTVEKFKGLNYRQQIIYNKNKLTIINDSKSTSFSSSIGILKMSSNIYWLVGGVPKKGDTFNLPKRYQKKIKAFIYGKNTLFFNKQLKDKVKVENFKSLSAALRRIFRILKQEKSIHETILFSPCAASFDSFRNFEDRGLFFNKLVKNYLNEG